MNAWKVKVKYIECGLYGKKYTVEESIVGLATTGEVACRQAKRVAKREKMSRCAIVGVEDLGEREF